MRVLRLLIISLTALTTISACSPKQPAAESSKSHDDPASAVVNSFVGEYYAMRVSNLSAFLNKYTDWPDFGPGDSVKIASRYSTRMLNRTDKTAQVEVTFKTIGEESLGKIAIKEVQDIQTYNLEKRKGAWRIVEPIQMPYVSVVAEIKELREFDNFALKRLQAGNFTNAEPEDYFRTVRENIKESLTALERYQ
jgi:hypothetical protein